MSKKKRRLGSDPLSWIKDSRNGIKINEIIDTDKQHDKVSDEKGISPS